MKTGKCIAAVFGCVILAVALGCGKSGTTAVNPADLAQLAEVCNDTCNTVMQCVQEVTGAEIPAGELEVLLGECLADCSAPAAEDQDERDCAIACEQAVDCADYIDCICGCGIEVIDGCV